MRFRQGRALVVAAALVFLAAAGIAHAQCGPMDVVFIIDNSGSMGPVIDQVKAQVGKIADSVTTASGGDYQFGLVTMPANDVNIVLDMSANNRAALDTAVQGMTTVGSFGLGIAYDEALDSVLNHLAPRKGSLGEQTGTFAASFRPDATKIIMIITDTGPQGFDSTLGTHADHAYAMANLAASQNIRIAGIFVPDGGGTNPVIDEPILQQVAAITGGLFLETAADASDLANVIIDVVAACGGAGGSTLLVDPTDLALANGESADVKVTNFSPGDLGTLVYSSNGLPSDSTVTFSTVANPEVEGTDQQTMHITVGPETPAGVYIVYVDASHTGATGKRTNYVLVNVDCTPPLILGLPGNQPANTTAGSNGKATLTVKPLGSLGLHYQWYQGHSGSTVFPVAGATAATFTTPAVTQPTEFWVRITNACGSRDSVTALVTPAP